jgi:hypothetical protein
VAVLPTRILEPCEGELFEGVFSHGMPHPGSSGSSWNYCFYSISGAIVNIKVLPILFM